jgi:hypothetical protein
MRLEFMKDQNGFIRLKCERRSECWFKIGCECKISMWILDVILMQNQNTGVNVRLNHKYKILECER